MNNTNNNAFNQFTLLPVTNTTLQIQSRHDINTVSVISKQVANVQKILEAYNIRFTQSIQSLTEKLTNNTHSQQIINDLQNVINIQDTMWKDLTQQKSLTDTELDKIKHQLMMSLVAQQQAQLQAQQQQVILINNMMQTQPSQSSILLNVVGNNHIQNTCHGNNPQMVQLRANNHPLIFNQNIQNVQVDTPDSNISNLSQLLNIMPTNISNNPNPNMINSNCNGISTHSHSCHNNMNSRSQNKILNVNNPFIVNNHNDNIDQKPVINSINNNNDVEGELAKLLATHSLPDNMNNTITANVSTNNNRKKRKRRGYNGPYSEEEKKFMRDFNRNKTTEDIMALSIEMENKFKVKRSPYGLAQKMYQMGIINSRLKAIFQRQFQNENNLCDEEKDPKLEGDDQSCNSNSSNENSKRRPFTSAELNYLNELINDYNNEQPRKLFWRFVQKFTNWNDTQKSYQKFYHKYWTLTNEKRAANNLKQEVDDDDSTQISSNSAQSRTSTKRKFSSSPFNNDLKRMKLN